MPSSVVPPALPAQGSRAAAQHPAVGHRTRYRQIARVLAQHGLGYLGALLHRGGGADAGDGSRRALADTPAAHVRLALQELGTTFVKLGQILSTRADLLPADYRAEFARLQDDDIPVPAPQIAAAVSSALGRPVEALFATFDWTPLAAASIGQVHAATLPDGREVVVKVRRPGVVEQVHEDLDILRHLAARAARHWTAASRYDVVGLVDEFSQVLAGELDYLREARDIERYRANFGEDADLHVPWVDWTRTAPGVLTMERIRGTKPLDLARLDSLGIDRSAVARRAAGIVLRTVFEHGFYHADPHPGNFFVEADGRIGLVDFGMTGEVDERTRMQLSALLVAVVDQDADALIDAMLDLGVARARFDRQALARDLDRLVSRYYGLPLSELQIGPLVENALTAVREHGLALPPRLALLLKTVVMAEGVGVQLDPDFHLSTLLVPLAARLLAQQRSPRRVAARFRRAGVDAALLATDLPRRLRRLLVDAERGSLHVGVHVDDADRVLRRLERMANRLVLGVLAAAFIVGLAVLLAATPTLVHTLWLRRMVAIGFAVVFAFGVHLAWGILRGARD